MDKKKILGFALGPMLSAVIGFISIPIIAWIFSPEDVGRMNIFTIFMSLSVLLFILGLDQSYVREYHQSSDRYSLLKACFLPGFLLLLFALLVSLQFADKLSMLLYGVHEPLWYQITAACVLANFASRFLALVIRMQERGLAYSASQVLPKLTVLFILMGYLTFGVQNNYSSLLLAQFASVMVVVCVFGWNARFEWLHAAKSRVDVAQLKKLLHFGIPLIGAGLAFWGLSATSTIALRSLSDFKELGIYSMSMIFAGAATIFQSIFATVWWPMVYKWVASGEDLSKIDAVTQHVLALVCLILVLTGMFSSVIDLLLPAEYVKVKYLIICSMVQPLLYTLSEATVVGINITRRTKYAFFATAAALLTNAMLSYWLVPTLGASGAAIANAVAFTVFFVARTEASVFVWRKFPRRKMYLFIFTGVALSVLSVLYAPLLSSYVGFAWAMLIPVIYISFRAQWSNILKILCGYILGGRKSKSA